MRARKTFGLGFMGLGALLLLSACQPQQTKSIAVHWQLIDGRSCTDAGAVRAVVALAGGEEHTGRCSQLPDGNRITLPDAYAEAAIVLRAESASQAVLYRAELTLPHELPDLVEAVLYYSGGR